MLYSIPNGFIGNSTDTKPTDGTVHPGYVYIEHNTGAQYIYTGSEWVEDLRTIYAFERVLKG